MNQNRLLILANAMALIAACWMWLQLDSAKSAVVGSTGKLKRCRELVQEIEVLKNESNDKIVVADASFDPELSMSKAVKAANLFQGNFFARQNRTGSVGKTKVSRWNISIPRYRISLNQAVALIGQLADSDVKFQVASIELNRLGKKALKTSGSGELWDVNFKEILYLKTEKDR